MRLGEWLTRTENHSKANAVRTGIYYVCLFTSVLNRCGECHNIFAEVGTKPRHFRYPTYVCLWRLVYIASAVFVFSYIAFDVLDLDLSDFPLGQAPRERVVVVTEVPKGTELVSLTGDAGLRMEPSLLDPAIFEESTRLQHKDTLRTLRSTAYPHIHRLISPRSSTRDSSPAA